MIKYFSKDLRVIKIVDKLPAGKNKKSLIQIIQYG